ncbi:MAG TPA: glycosyltransferase family 4 protein [Trueperaceae bacterium]|nr:glycosyltransferase family 4 protein [Trueperaceae bacterium]
MVRSLERRLDVEVPVRTEVVSRSRVLIVADFSASKLGNASVAEQLAAKLRASGDQVIATSDKTNRWLRASDMVASAIRYRHAVDVAIIDVYSGAAFRWAEWATSIVRSAGTPVIHVLRGGNLPKFAAANPDRVKRLFGLSNAVVALSGFLYEEMAPYGPIAEVIPNPLEAGAYPFRRRSTATPEMVWLRSFNTIYNPTLGPRVLAEVAAVYPATSPVGARLTMIGSDQGDGSLQSTEAVATELGIRDQLVLKGRVPKADVPQHLSKGDIFINTTDVDNVPITVLEAMACGLCVVTTDVGGLPYLLADGVDALLVPRDDPKAMANAVLRIIEEPGLADRLSNNGRAKAESFDWSKVLPRWRSLIANVAVHGERR